MKNFKYTSLATFLVLQLLHLNCGLNTTSKSKYKVPLNDITKTKYTFDTTQYLKHKSGFLVSKNKDIFQLNTITFDDSNGIWISHYWLDSLMFYGNYPNKKPLKDIIDLETFEIDTQSRFEKDKNNVYYSRPTSDGIYRSIVNNAEPKSFKCIGGFHGKDAYNIYYETEKVKDADVNTFQVLDNIDSAKDKNHYYYLGEKVK